MSRAVILLASLLLLPTGLRAQGAPSAYRRACEGGELIQCALLGLIYETGAAGVRDVPRALELYERACSREVLSACRRLELSQEGAMALGPDDELVRVGYVADAFDGAPLGGAVVRVRGAAGIGEFRYVADEAGRVQVARLPHGRHAIQVQRGGYQVTEGNLPVPWDGDFLILMERIVEEEGELFGGIFGQVTEDGSDRGIANVDIRVTAGGDTRTLSNNQGRFRIGRLEPGPVVVELTRIGYEPRVVTVNVQPGRTVQIYAGMASLPIELEPVEVTVTSRYLERSGFYRRAESASGERFTHRDITRMSPTSLGDVMRRVPGVQVVSSQIGNSSEVLSSRRDGSGRCRLMPYFNGTPTVNFELELVPPEEIEALEVYQGASVPIEYMDQRQLFGPRCGVILIWTRDPQRRD
jgi:hypothetical protein